MGRKRNMEAIVQIIILISIGCLLIYAMISKKINYYVHPRFYMGIVVSIIIVVLFAISLISKIKKARHNVNLRHYIIFAIPLLGALLFPATGINNKDMTIANSDIAASNNETDTNTIDDANTDRYYDENITNEKSPTDIIDATASNQQNDGENKLVEEKSNAYEKYSQYEVDGVLVINDEIFADWYGDVYDNLDDFVGKKCKYLAQVYSMEDFKPNQFLAGRYFMVCCAADLVGYGIVCESDKRSKLKDDEWITVTGTISEYKYNGYMVPILKNVTITDGKAPEVEYIYYNNY